MKKRTPFPKVFWAANFCTIKLSKPNASTADMNTTEKRLYCQRFFNIIIFWRNAVFNKSLLVFLLFIFFISCSPKIMAPPTIDLLHYEHVGLISFSSQNVKSQLGEMAAQLFYRKLAVFKKESRLLNLAHLMKFWDKSTKQLLIRKHRKLLGSILAWHLFFMEKFMSLMLNAHHVK